MRFFSRRVGLGILMLTLSGCGQGDSSDVGRVDGGESVPDRPTVAVTSWTERSELFMEYPMLVAGETALA